MMGLRRRKARKTRKHERQPLLEVEQSDAVTAVKPCLCLPGTLSCCGISANLKGPSMGARKTILETEVQARNTGQKAKKHRPRLLRRNRPLFDNRCGVETSHRRHRHPQSTKATVCTNHEPHGAIDDDRTTTRAQERHYS